MLRIPDFPVHHRGVVWESGRRGCNVFVAWNDEKCDVFVFHQERLSGNIAYDIILIFNENWQILGSSIIRLCTIPIANEQNPLYLQGSELILLNSSSRLATLNIPQLGLDPNTQLSSMSRDDLLSALEISLAIGR